MKKSQSEFELIAMMAFLMSNIALSIDAILPALTDIGFSIQNSDNASLQLIISIVFLGLALGELIFGSLSDSYGRKPIVYVGMVLFTLASFLITSAKSLEIMLLGRFLQGIGLSAARTISIAIIRDLYKGDRMARIMSFITAIFILVPMIAPIIGKIILDLFFWQAIVYFQMIFALGTLIWFGLRLKETLPREKRIPYSIGVYPKGVREFLKHSNSLLCILMASVIMGGFILYLGSSKQIFQDQYQLIDSFPYIFGALAFTYGLATFLNGSLVLKLGMEKLIGRAAMSLSFIGLLYVFLFFQSGNPSIFILVIFIAAAFTSIGFIFGNLSALAMRPLGHIAGIGAALYSFSSMSLAVLISILVGPYMENSALPLFLTFAGAGLLTLLLKQFIKPEEEKN